MSWIPGIMTTFENLTRIMQGLESRRILNIEQLHFNAFVIHYRILISNPYSCAELSALTLKSKQDLKNWIYTENLSLILDWRPSGDNANTPYSYNNHHFWAKFWNKSDRDCPVEALRKDTLFPLFVKVSRRRCYCWPTRGTSWWWWWWW
jgi:hypothetical protein